jgi:rRNA maturation endonuclease Nob1
MKTELKKEILDLLTPFDDVFLSGIALPIAIKKIRDVLKEEGPTVSVKSSCSWRIVCFESNLFSTECKKVFSFNEGGPKENEFDLCPFCGKKIEEILFEEEKSDEK